jgi:hypothetical protein
MRPVGAYWGHFAAKNAEISTNGSTRSESRWRAEMSLDDVAKVASHHFYGSDQFFSGHTGMPYSAYVPDVPDCVASGDTVAAVEREKNWVDC